MDIWPSLVKLLSIKDILSPNSIWPRLRQVALLQFDNYLISRIFRHLNTISPVSVFVPVKMVPNVFGTCSRRMKRAWRREKGGSNSYEAARTSSTIRATVQYNLKTSRPGHTNIHTALCLVFPPWYCLFRSGPLVYLRVPLLPLTYGAMRPEPLHQLSATHTPIFHTIFTIKYTTNSSEFWLSVVLWVQL